MSEKLRNQKEALERIRANMAKKSGKVYNDALYYQKKIEVYKVTFMDGSIIYVSEKVGEQIQQEMIKENSSRAVKLGKGVWRTYDFKSVVPVLIRFCELSDWAESKALGENPKLFDDWYESFSPELKRWIDRLKKGKDLDSNLRIEREK